MKNLNMPSEKLKQQFFVRFCSTSPDASSNEQFQAFLENWWVQLFIATFCKLRHEHSGHEKYMPAYDCQLKCEILFRIFPHHLPGDNPQQAESASGIGGNGNLNCIRDKSGGTKEQKESDAGYHALFAVCITITLDIYATKSNSLKPGEMRRTVVETVQIIQHQIHLACEGVACRVTEFQTETGIKDRTAQYWIDQALERSSKLIRKRTNGSETQDPRLKGKLEPGEQKQIKATIQSETAAEVYRWVIEQPPERYAKLPQDSGEFKCLTFNPSILNTLVTF